MAQELSAGWILAAWGIGGLLAIALLYLHSVGELLVNVAGVLAFFSALVGYTLSARRTS